MKINHLVSLCFLLVAGITSGQVPSDTAFTFQGQLHDNGVLASGSYDLEFTAYDAKTGGNQIGSKNTLSDTSVINGIFTVTLDFGVLLTHTTWLEIAIRTAGVTENYTQLSPRIQVTPAPLSNHATLADNIPWSGISQVPVDFADNVDNDTTYAAGTGLLLSGTTLFADTSYLQRRVSGTCIVGSAIRAISSTGQVTCGNFISSGLKTISLDASAFRSTASDDITIYRPSILGGGGLFFRTVKSSEGGVLVAPVALPSGATIKTINLYYILENSARTDIILDFVSFDSIIYDYRTIDSIQSAGPTGGRPAVLSLNLNYVISPQTESYFIRIRPTIGWEGEYNRILMATIQYNY